MITARWRRVAKHDTMQRVSPEGTRRMGQCAVSREKSWRTRLEWGGAMSYTTSTELNLKHGCDQHSGTIITSKRVGVSAEHWENRSQYGRPRVTPPGSARGLGAAPMSLPYLSPLN